MSISIYVKENNLSEIEKWVYSVFDSTSLVQSEDDLSIYHGLFEDNHVSISVTINVSEEHEFSCLYFVFSGQSKWANDSECAKDAFSIFGKKVVCSTNEIDSNPYLWLHISETGQVVSDKSW
jgi:hypothetical protein